jgi:tetratricopeptide (TPR) repeat protein
MLKASMHTLPAVLSTVTLALVAASPVAASNTFKDAGFEALYRADKTAELQRSASQRLASKPDDTQALLALALVATDRNDTKLRREVLDQARACTERQPQAEICHYAHGVLLGLQAMNEGMLAAARSAGTVREALARAHELDPAWYPARSALLEFHVAAPAMMGGSSARARELAGSAPSPEQAAVLSARLLLDDGKAAEALDRLGPVLPKLDGAEQDDGVAFGTQAGLKLVNDGQAAKAQAWFERLSRELPGESAGPYGLARVKGELGDWAGALALLERSATLKGAQRWPIAYRVGIAQQQLGQTAAARESFQRFVDAGKGQKASLEDARKRLKALAP